MPDFGKALRKLQRAFDPHPALRANLSQWERDNLPANPSPTGRGWREAHERSECEPDRAKQVFNGEGRSFAAELKYLGSRWQKAPPQLTLDTSDILPPGETEYTPLGSH